MAADSRMVYRQVSDMNPIYFESDITLKDSQSQTQDITGCQLKDLDFL